MPSKTYPSTDNSISHVAKLRSYSAAACAATGSSTTSGDTTYFSKVDRSTALGWETPGWRKMRNSGHILPMTYWRQFHVTAQASLGQRGWCDVNSRKRIWENFYYSGDPNIDLLDSSFLMDKVDPYDLQYYVQKAASSIYSKGWDAATFLAEIGQLRRMLTGVSRKLDSLIKGRNDLNPFDLWLEGRYGWRTLRYDIIDFYEALSLIKERRTRYNQSVGYTHTGSWNNVVEGTSSAITHKNDSSISWTISERGRVIADIDVPAFQINPVTTAWEVTRLSFVVDWLLNVGQALEAASFLLKAKAYVAAGGVKVDFNFQGTHSLVSYTGGLTNVFTDGSWSGSASYVERVPMTVSALPRLKLRLDEYKVIDLLALIVQRLR